MKNIPIRTAVAVLLSIGLSACGGGDDTTTTTGGGDVVAAACTAPAETLTYAANPGATGNPHANGDKVCFEASTTTLKFSGKTLTGPTQNTAVSAPYSAYKFADGSVFYEVVFNAGALYEINVNGPSNTPFYGQFAK